MECNYTATFSDSLFKMIPPLFYTFPCGEQRRASDGVSSLSGADDKMGRKPRPRSFTVKGRVLNLAGGEYRMVIAGSILRRREV